MTRYTSLRRDDGSLNVRAHVWTDFGYSTRTFLTVNEARSWAQTKLASAKPVET